METPSVVIYLAPMDAFVLNGREPPSDIFAAKDIKGGALD